MKFTWDENKNKQNLAKHGIDFEDITEVFDDLERIEREDLRKDEKRYQVIGQVEGVVLLVAYTYRKSSIRIISARRARRKERQLYQELKNG